MSQYMHIVAGFELTVAGFDEHGPAVAFANAFICFDPVAFTHDLRAVVLPMVEYMAIPRCCMACDTTRWIP